MRIVVDTNVLISATLKTNSVPALAIDLIVREHKFLSSLDTQCEIHRVIARPKFRRYLTAQAVILINTFFSESDLITVEQSITACRDPMDDKFLELALNGKADVIVSGDKDLLAMENYKGISIITPADFLKPFQT